MASILNMTTLIRSLMHVPNVDKYVAVTNIEFIHG